MKKLAGSEDVPQDRAANTYKRQDMNLNHAKNVQCFSAHFNKEYLSAHGSTLFMDTEYNDAMNPSRFGNSIHVSQQESYPHMSEYARANVNIDLSNLNISQDEMESDGNIT